MWKLIHPRITARRHLGNATVTFSMEHARKPAKAAVPAQPIPGTRAHSATARCGSAFQRSRTTKARTRRAISSTYLAHAVDCEAGGIVDGPIIAPHAHHDWTLLAASHRDEPRRPICEAGRQPLRLGFRQVDPDLAHRLDDDRMNPCRRLCARRHRASLRWIGTGVEERGGHLRPAGIVHARKYDEIAHTFFRKRMIAQPGFIQQEKGPGDNPALRMPLECAWFRS